MSHWLGIGIPITVWAQKERDLGVSHYSDQVRVGEICIPLEYYKMRKKSTYFPAKYYKNLRINFRNNYLLKRAFKSSFQSSNFPFLTFQEVARHSIFLFCVNSIFP